MTENEAISMMRYRIDTASQILGKGTNGKAYEDMEMAISSMKEIQQYREIGTVEECTTAMEYWKYLRERRCGLNAVVEKCMKYEQIGTVEECREAMEKQKTKKPKDELTINPVIDENGAYVDADMTVYLLCPNCGEMVGIDENIDRFCSECGQAIDNDNLEGMEDEEN